MSISPRVLTKEYSTYDMTLTPKSNFKRSSVTHAHSAECLVSRSFGLVLRLSRLVGTAPLNMKWRRDEWLVSVSPCLCVASFIGVTFIFTATLAGLIVDITFNNTKSGYIKSKIKRVVWIWDFLTVLLIAFTAAYQAPMRLRETFCCLNRIQKLNISTKSDSDKKSEDRKRVAILVFVFFSLSLLIVDYWFFIEDVFIFNRSKESMFLYAGFYLSYIMVFCLEMQFAFSAMEIQKTLTSLNDLIEDLLRIIKLQNGPFDTMVSTAFLKVVPVKSLNVVIDSIAMNVTCPGYKTTNTPKPIHENIRSVASTYSVVCDTVRQLNDTYGIGLTFLVISAMVHLIITPYNLITNISSSLVCYEQICKEMAWSLLHLFCTVVLVEPCHRTQVQVDRTRSIISQMMIKTSDSTLYTELEKFSCYLFLNNVSYSPFGIFTLTRSLIATIVGSVTTYLVIIMQFQASED